MTEIPYVDVIVILIVLIIVWKKKILKYHSFLKKMKYSLLSLLLLLEFTLAAIFAATVDATCNIVAQSSL